MKWKTIITTAEKIKKSIEKNKTLPTITNYGTGQLLYILAKAVQNPNKDIADKKVANAPNPTGNNISKNLTQTEYQTVAKNTVKWINEREVAPNFTTHNGYNISVKLQLYAYAKIIVYYDEHSNTLPRTCWFKYSDVSNTASKTTNNTKSQTSSTSTIKKYGHSTEHCCDDMGQNNGYYCGCHSLQEVFRNLTGIVVPQSTIASWAGTTTSGTDHDGLNTAVAVFNKKYGYNLQVKWEHFSDIGWSGIKKVINSNNQDCVVHNCYRNQWGHYEVINNLYTDYSKVQNSLGSQCSNGCYYGYVEERYNSTFASYIADISQKSIMIITRK